MFDRTGWYSKLSETIDRESDDQAKLDARLTMDATLVS